MLLSSIRNVYREQSYIAQKPIHRFFVQVILKALLLPNSTEYLRCRDAITGYVNIAGFLF